MLSSTTKLVIATVWAGIRVLVAAAALVVLLVVGYRDIRHDIKHLIAMRREHPKVIAFHGAEGTVIILRECEAEEDAQPEIRSNYHGQQFCEVEVSEVTK